MLLTGRVKLNSMSSDPRDNEELVARQRAELLQSSYTDVRQIKELVRLDEIISLADMQKYQVLPLQMTPHQLILGFCQATTKTNVAEIKQHLSTFNVEFSFISDSGYRELLQRYQLAIHPPKLVDPDALSKSIAKEVLDVRERTENPELFTAQLAQTEQKDLFKLVAQQAYSLGASDIHIEPAEQNIRLRFRIDGVMHQMADLPLSRFDLLLSALQMKSGIKWNAAYAQTGSLAEGLFNKAGQVVNVNMRVETIPTTHGSDVVVRLFNMDVQFLNLANLGLSSVQRQNIDQLITHPHGLVLMVGPTGSGKTSTLYSIINQLNRGDVKIVTLEDPIEYRLPGITQIPVDTERNESFGDKLKSVLREDPDIIMIGEIRDVDTAKTALQSALTGHLVLSTYHANNAAAAVSRLMDMIGQNPLLASALKLVMAQRLLRRLCTHCKQAYIPDAQLVDKLNKNLANLKDKPSLENLKLYRPTGCAKCYHIGYAGRVMATEQLIMNTPMQELISRGTAQTTEQVIHNQSVSAGMITLLQDAVLKAIAGVTSVEEVFRVIEA